MPIVALLLSTLLTVSAICAPPPILRPGMAPHTTLTYRFYGAWRPHEQHCVQQSLRAWEDATANTLDLHFVYATDPAIHPQMTLTKTRVPYPIGGAVVGLRTTTEGYLAGGGIVYSDDPTRLSSCMGYQKTTLHEVGHLLGLGHVTHPMNGRPVSIMQPTMQGANDHAQELPETMTLCDIDQAVHAAQGIVVK
jgi:hypothetical protein